MFGVGNVKLCVCVCRYLLLFQKAQVKKTLKASTQIHWVSVQGVAAENQKSGGLTVMHWCKQKFILKPERKHGRGSPEHFKNSYLKSLNLVFILLYNITNTMISSS